MNKKSGEQVKDLSLEAVRSLSKILPTVERQITKEEFIVLKRAVGSCIGHIEGEILSIIYSKFPDLDDLKDK